ncbi:MAG: PP2C family protein-serine/threonine phosphatase [Acidobacteria bacterium]|nr:PP2C family protein-serine/threonine phosphatase [Acidobacteriota bacterium]
MNQEASDSWQAEIRAEFANLEEIALATKPASGDLPDLRGVDIDGISMPLRQAIGGDHLIYLDFKQRYDLERRIREAEAAGNERVVAGLRQSQQRAGVLVADVSGHKATDALVAAMLHQAFLLGAYYELDLFGEITTRLFEHINQRFYKSTTLNKYLTMLYGEVSEQGRFRFFSAGHPAPLLFAGRPGRIEHLREDQLVRFPPVGMFASNAYMDELVDPGPLGYKRPYEVSEVDLLEAGDLLLLYTDGFAEHGEERYVAERAESLLEAVRGLRASEICKRLRDDLVAFAPPEDDVSFVVIKKTQ